MTAIACTSAFCQEPINLFSSTTAEKMITAETAIAVRTATTDLLMISSSQKGKKTADFFTQRVTCPSPPQMVKVQSAARKMRSCEARLLIFYGRTKVMRAVFLKDC
jgi:hypothetical protein